jgi:adenylate kinase family enzyme
MKVLVFGNSGSGKSTYARALAARESVPHLDLDVIVWEPGQVAVQRLPESFEDSFRSFIDLYPAWVIEGCYGELVRAASAHCTLMVFLNPGTGACLANNLKRALGATQICVPSRVGICVHPEGRRLVIPRPS